MQYFYLLNNKDIYGINGRFFGPNLSVCDCVDYFKQIGVQEGTSMDLTFGGFNGCYVYANNNLIKTLPSCGYSPGICSNLTSLDWNISYCICGSYIPPANYPSEIVFISSNLIALGQNLQYQAQVVPYGQEVYSPNWNINIQDVIPAVPGSVYSKAVARRTDSTSSTNYKTAYVRIRKSCGINLINNQPIFSAWSDIKFIHLVTIASSQSCSVPVC